MTSNDYQEALKNAAKTMVRVKNPHRLLKMIVRFIVREVKLTHASILIYDQTRARYIFVDSQGSRRIPIHLVKLDETNPLIRWFLKKEPGLKLGKDFLSASELASWLEDEHLLNGKVNLRTRLIQLEEVMGTLNAAVCVPGYYKQELLGVLILGWKANGEAFSPAELSFFQTLANDASMAIKTAAYREDLLEKNLELERRRKELEEKLREIEQLRKKEQETYYQIVMSLAHEVYAKDPYTSGHLEGVERLGLITAEELGYDLSGRKRDVLVAALHLHDVGKIGIPDHILKKTSSLTDAEWKIMRQHPARGAKILEPLASFRDVAKIVLHHHENYDGTGYPSGLRAEEIPLESRIISVVDAFHAIVSTRCYSKGRPVEFAFRELERCGNTQFDPRVVDAFIRAYCRANGISRNPSQALAS